MKDMYKKTVGLSILATLAAVPVLELLPLAVVSGGQVQIRWAGLAWH